MASNSTITIQSAVNHIYNGGTQTGEGRQMDSRRSINTNQNLNTPHLNKNTVGAEGILNSLGGSGPGFANGNQVNIGTIVSIKVSLVLI